MQENTPPADQREQQPDGLAETEAPPAHPDAAVSEPAPPAADVMPSLEESLRAAELKAAEHHDAWLRANTGTA